MRLFYHAEFALAYRLSFSTLAHKFATFVAILSTVGIAIGVAALIIVSSIMGGLQERLKNAALSGSAQVIVEAPPEKAGELLQLPGVIAAAPYISGQVLLQAPDGIALVNLQGNDLTRASFKDGIGPGDLRLGTIPADGSYALTAQASIFTRLNLLTGQGVRLISTSNARYTPLGIVPSQRIFYLNYYTPAISNSSAIPEAMGAYDDVRRLLRLPVPPDTLRLWLDDPFAIEDLTAVLAERGFDYTDWRENLGEFFKAVALEKLSMSIMLTLIILVAAFNILSALTMMVGARLTDIAVLKTLGLKSGQILRTFMLMGLSYGFLGSAAGSLLGVPGTYLIAEIMSASLHAKMPVSLSALNIVVIIAGSLFITVLSTLYPSLKAAAADPVTHLARG